MLKNNKKSFDVKHIFHFFSYTSIMINVSDKKQSALNISENESFISEARDDFKEKK